MLKRLIFQVHFIIEEAFLWQQQETAISAH